MNNFLQSYVLIALTLLTINCEGQHYNNVKSHADQWLEYLNDTLDYRQPKIDTVASLSDLRAKYKIIDSINNPDGIIFKIAEQEPGSIVMGKAYFILAIKRENLFLTFPILSFDSNEDIRTERVYFGDSIEPKLLIHQSFNYGFPFTPDGVSFREFYQLYELWDLKEIKLLFNFRNYYTGRRWEHFRLVNAACRCDNFDIEVAGQELTIKELDVCDKYSELLMNWIKDPHTITYHWTPSALIKKK